ncbi:MAG: DUF7266 family protein [Halodesulfurarchaeum sp.]
MIRNGSPTRQDRAVSVAVTHVLAIGITTILIVGLLTAAGGLAKDEQEQSAREQLRMVGSSMASQIEHADALGRRGANVSVREDFEGTVSGKSYTVDFETGSECDAATIDTDACLVLNLSNSDVSATVGVSNRSAVTFEHLGSGTVRIVSEPGGTAGDAPYDPTVLEQVGVGGSVYDLPPGTGSLAELNKPPVAKFTVDPESPQYGETIILNASKSSDPEANISKYIWNFTGGPDAGKFNQTTENDTIAVPTGEIPDIDTLGAGRYTVELTVVDPAGNKGRTSEFVKVAGLVYGGDAMAADVDDDDSPQSVKFHLVNKHSKTAHVTETYINPEDDTIDGLREDIGDYGYHEISIMDSSLDSGSRLGYADSNYGFDVFEGGKVIVFDESNSYDIPHISSGEAPQVYFMKFQNALNMTGKPIETAFRYYVDEGGEKVYYSTQFNMTPGSPYVSGLSPSTYEQCWRAGSSGHKIQANFENVDDSDSVAAEVMVASGKLDTYDWTDSSTPGYIDPESPQSNGKVKVTGDLNGVSVPNPEYLVVEVTVWNDRGSKTKRFFIEVQPSGGSCS